MRHFDILRRAWEKTWRYQTLWIFGLFVALTANGMSGGGNSGLNVAGSRMEPGFHGGVELPEPLLGFIAAFVVMLVIVLVVVGLIFALGAAIARYVGESALIQLVDQEEAGGPQPTLEDGFRLAWSEATLRLFVVDLVVKVPLALLAIALILLSGTPLLLWLTRDVGAGIVGTVLAVGFFIIMLIFIGLIGALVSVFTPFYRRRTVLAERGVFAAIGEGVSLVVKHLGNVLLMWLIMIFINFLGGLALTLVVLLLMLLVLLVAGLPAILIGWLFNILFNTPLGYVIGGMGMLPWFFGLVVLPSLLFEGLLMVFKSTIWTLTYRELLGMESAAGGGGDDAE